MSPWITQRAPTRLLAIAGALLTVAILVPRSKPHTVSPAPIATPSPPAPPVERVSVRVFSEPAGARVETAMDGVVGRTPIDLKVARGVAFDLRVSFEGYHSRVKTIKVDHDTVIELRLAPLADPPRPRKHERESSPCSCNGDCLFLPCF